MQSKEMSKKVAPTKRKLYIIHGNAKAFKIMEIWQPNEKSANIIWQGKVKHTACHVETEMKSKNKKSKTLNGILKNV